MDLLGAHGTCRTFSYQIEKKGFKAGTGGGRRGSGIYFWAYANSNGKSRARSLAQGWWAQSLDRGSYQHASHTGCAIIYVRLVGIQEALDFDSLEVRDQFLAFAEHAFDRNISQGSMHYNDEACRVHDLFVAMMEEECGISFDLLQVRVPGPGQRHFNSSLPIDMTGQYPCLVVRNPKIIEIQEVERL
jgi:hypothetical protein